MHVADLSVGMLGGERHCRRRYRNCRRQRVRPQASLARDAIAVAFFGDGAMAEGVLHESLNIAMLEKDSRDFRM